MNLNRETIQGLTDLAASDLLSNPSRVLDLTIYGIGNLAPLLVLDTAAIEAVSRVSLIERSRVLSTDVVALKDCKAAIMAILKLIPELQSCSDTLAKSDDYYLTGYLESLRVAVIALSRYLQTVVR